MTTQEPAIQRDDEKRTLTGFLVVPYLLLVVLKLFLAGPLDCPLKGDELGYLSNARYLATGGGLIDPEGRATYKVGYSLWLIPAFRLTADPAAAFQWVQVINAFLLSLIYPAAFLLAGRLRRDLSPFDRMLAAGCVSLYPAAQLYATTAMIANVFLPAYFAVLLAAFAALARPRWWTWAAFGVAAAYLYTVHERAVGSGRGGLSPAARLRGRGWRSVPPRFRSGAVRGPAPDPRPGRSGRGAGCRVADRLDGPERLEPRPELPPGPGGHLHRSALVPRSLYLRNALRRQLLPAPEEENSAIHGRSLAFLVGTLRLGGGRLRRLGVVHDLAARSTLHPLDLRPLQRRSSAAPAAGGVARSARGRAQPAGEGSSCRAAPPGWSRSWSLPSS